MLLIVGSAPHAQNHRKNVFIFVCWFARAGAPRFVNINKTNKNLIEQVETLKYFILELDNEREFLRFQLS